MEVGGKCELFVRYRSADGSIASDRDDAVLAEHEGSLFLSSPMIVGVTRSKQDPYLVLYFEGTKRFSRCLVRWWEEDEFNAVEKAGEDVHLRLDVYDLPPSGVGVVEDGPLHEVLVRYAEARDPDLFSIQAGRFLDGPHVLERLFDHLMELRASEAPNFITVTKGLADELRTLLTGERSAVKICTVEHSHLNAWAHAQGKPVSFVDGGVARLPTYPGIEQFAMRVGTYRVTPGDDNPESREHWQMTSCILPDVVDLDGGTGVPDRKRLQEAIRYCFESLVTLRALEARQDQAVFLHGPLINQFVTYDEDTPHNLPPLNPEFLARFGIDKESIVGAVPTIPLYPDGHPRWNQFMALYGLISQRLIRAPVPAIGVVERTVSHHVTAAILKVLTSRGSIQPAFQQRFMSLVQKFGVTDDLLFGCVLKQGEYVSPVRVVKSPDHRAHPIWQPVVKLYGNPQSSLMKPDEATFPVRLEMNDEAASKHSDVVSLAYHTARLLPRYAFPVGLDIVDKYAKIPDWITKAISAATAGAMLKRAVEEYDDPVRIAQIRRVLAGQPRDFFFRPHAS